MARGHLAHLQHPLKPEASTFFGGVASLSETELRKMIKLHEKKLVVRHPDGKGFQMMVTPTKAGSRILGTEDRPLWSLYAHADVFFSA